MFLTATKGEMTIKQEYAVPDREIRPRKYVPRHDLCNFAVVFQNCIDEGTGDMSVSRRAIRCSVYQHINLSSLFFDIIMSHISMICYQNDS